jgi:hypothetical protein
MNSLDAWLLRMQVASRMQQMYSTKHMFSGRGSTPRKAVGLLAVHSCTQHRLLTAINLVALRACCQQKQGLCLGLQHC